MTKKNRWKAFENSLIDEKYYLHELLGAGKHGGVFRADHRVQSTTIRVVAVKLLPFESKDRDVHLQKVALPLSLRHPHLIECYDTGICTLQGAEYLYLVMELAEESLSDSQNVLSHQELFCLLRSLVSALRTLHEHPDSLLHGDIKPSNVLKVNGVWKLADFGLLQSSSINGSAYSKIMPGSANYQSPEAFTGTLSTASDIWELGILGVQALSGTLPFEALTPRHLEARILNDEPSIPSDVPVFCRYFFKACLHKDPTERATARQLEKLLTCWYSGIIDNVLFSIAVYLRDEKTRRLYFPRIRHADPEFAVFDVHSLVVERLVYEITQHLESYDQIVLLADKLLALVDNKIGLSEEFYLLSGKRTSSLSLHEIEESTSDWPPADCPSDELEDRKVWERLTGFDPTIDDG